MHDDFYEPSEFEEEIETMKDTLRASVKKEIQQEIESLKKENAELQDIKKNWNKKVQELEKEKQNLQFAVSQAEREAKKARLHELFADYTFPAYASQYKWEYKREKCDKCDSNGYIHYKTPLGRDARELCSCRARVITYSVIEVEMIKIKDTRLNDVTVYFSYDRKEDSDEDEYTYCTTSRIYDGQEYNLLDSYNGRVVFLNKEECQKYCDYLNTKQ